MFQYGDGRLHVRAPSLQLNQRLSNRGVLQSDAGRPISHHRVSSKMSISVIGECFNLIPVGSFLNHRPYGGGLKLARGAAALPRAGANDMANNSSFDRVRASDISKSAR